MSAARSVLVALVALVALASVLTVAPPLLAQRAAREVGEWRTARFTVREGLPSNEVVQLAESRSGRLWAGTAQGLAWFDGWSWHAITSGLPPRRAKRITPVAGDSMLVLMHNLLYVGDTSGFGRLVVRTRQGDSLVEQQVLDAVQTFEGLYVLLPGVPAQDSARLYRMQDGAFNAVATPAPIGGRNVASLHPASGDGAWLNTTSGLWRFDRSGWHLQLRAEGSSMVFGVVTDGPEGSGFASVESPQSRAGLWDWERGESPRRRTEEGDNRVLSGIVSSDERMIAVYTGGNARIRRRGIWSRFDVGAAEALDARVAFVDRLADTWIGTGTGLILRRESSRLWAGIPHGFPSVRDRVSALVEAPDGALWAGTGDGIDIFDPDGRIRRVRTAAGITLRLVTSMARDSSGNLWVSSGSDFSGALRWDGRVWRHFGRNDGLDAEHVHRVTVDRAGRVWFLGIGGADDQQGGPGAFVLENGRFERVGVPEGLPSGRVYDFADAPDGTRWFGTAAGLSRWRAGVWTHWKSRSGIRRGMRFRNTPIKVFSLSVDAQGRPWFGDRDENFPYGLGTLDERDSLAFYTTEDGLLSDLVWSVDASPDGTIWIGTVSGLSAFRDGLWFSFGTDRGLGYPQIWPLLATDSLITVGTLGGGVRQLQLSDARVAPPHVRLTQPAIDGRRALLEWQPLAWRGTVLSALIETRYRIDGEAWTRWNTERSAVLAGLSSGLHRVDFQAKGLFLPVDSVSASVEFRIPAPLIFRPAFGLPVGGLTLALIALSLVSLRRQRENTATLRDGESRFRALAASTFEGIGLSVDGVIVEANEQLHRMLGAPSGSLLGRDIDGIVGIADQLRSGVPLEGTLQSRQARRDDGALFPAEVRERSLPFRGASARVTAIRDLSERVRADAALRASEERFETMFRLSPSPIAIAAWPSAEFVDVSEGFAEATGYSRDEILGRTMTELGLYQDLQQRDSLNALIAGQRRARGVELAIRTRNGGVRIVIGSFELMTLDAKPHLLAVITDITERRALEGQLLQSQKMDAIGQLAGGVAHDFNNLLTVIIGHVELLRDAVESPEARRDLQEIREASARAADLTRQLLTFARKQPVQPQIVDLSVIVQRLQRMLGRLLGEQVVIVTQTASDLPMVKADPGQVEQVVVNLAVNARDAMPDGGRLTIETQAVTLDRAYSDEHLHVAPGSYAMIAVSDTGAGIPDDVLPRIFEPFFTTKEIGRGTGLGLAICYGIVHEAGGHIAVYSEQGHGTTVRVYLPATGSTTAATESASVSAPPGGTETVLVVEDEAVVRSLLKRILGSVGYTVIIAEDLPAALIALERAPHAPELLITDVVLPGPGGPEIAAAVRARIPGIAVLYISGYTERATNRSIALDAPLLSKPFTPNQLGRAVREILDGR